jgi:hypothetical protein
MADANEQSEKFNALIKEAGLVDNTSGKNVERPLIKVPSDQRELIDFCRECAVELSKEGRLFRRDRTPVIVNHEKARLDPITARTLCSFSQRYIRFYKFKTVEKENGEKETRTVLKNIPAQIASANGSAGSRAISLTSATSPTRAAPRCFWRCGCACGVCWGRRTSIFALCGKVDMSKWMSLTR